MNVIKLTYITIGTALLLGSCAKEEGLDPGIPPGDNRIVFRTALPEVTTRAGVVTKESIDKFHVTAFNPFPTDPALSSDRDLPEFVKNVLVEKVENSSFYSSLYCRWPDEGEESDVLHFFAYYPSLNEGTTISNASTVSGDVVNYDYKINNFRVASDIGDQVDFVAAYGTGSMDNNLFSGINLEFKHKLSRIEVKAKSSNKSCKIEIAGVRIGGIHTLGTYNFKAEESTGYWTLSDEKENVEYIFGPEDKIVALNYTTEAVSIMGGKNGVNYAMLLPNSYPDGWDFANDRTNSNKLMYISVLLRVIDKTPTAGEGGKPTQQYPYFDTSQGLNAMNIPREYFAVVKSSGKVSKRLYKKNDSYFSDAACTQSYTLSSGEEVREFGWASLPITGNWEAGYSYTYTLDYTSGVGLHDPSVGGTISPRAGDPIISDIVGVSVSVNDWQGDNKGNENTINDVVVPGS